MVAILPAWRTARQDVERTLRAGALTTTTDRAGGRTRGSLLALQVALSLMLLVVTGLLGASLARPVAVERGFVAGQALLVPRSLGVGVLRGRAFTEADRGPGHTMPALVSEPTAKRLWPDQDPLGKKFSRAIPGEAGFEVVGIVADAKLTSLERTPPLMVYLPYWWRTRQSTSLVIKAAADPSALMPPVRRAVRAIDPEIAIGNARPLEPLVDASVAARRS